MYDITAILALMHVAGLGGVGGYLISTGHLTAEKIKQIVEVVRGQKKEIDQSESSASPTEVTQKQSDSNRQTGSFLPGVDRFNQYLVDQEILYQQKQRFDVEMQQKLDQINSAMLQVNMRQEALDVKIKAQDKRQQQITEQKDEVGMKKEVSILAALSSKKGLELLLKKDPQEAAQLLLQMNTFNAANIVDAAKTQQQQDQLQTILNRMRDVAPAKVNKIKNEK